MPWCSSVTNSNNNKVDSEAFDDSAVLVVVVVVVSNSDGVAVTIITINNNNNNNNNNDNDNDDDDDRYNPIIIMRWVLRQTVNIPKEHLSLDPFPNSSYVKSLPWQRAYEYHN
uniref:Uncharacterized protein n=1 Tax=Vespula pensylvanica TaxID=30213 RepID=A0A834NLR1_VESPE|nr:hypothetical protein H0235_012700 [Vespula pensylvanica]